MNKLAVKCLFMTALLAMLGCTACIVAFADTAYVMASAPVYAKPSKSAKKLGSVKIGTKLDLVATKGEWARVELDGNEGFMKASAVAKITNHSDMTVYTKSKTSVYKKFSTSSKKLGALSAGEKLTLHATAGGWAYISLDGNHGYVKTSKLTEDAPKPAEKKTITAYVAKDGAKVFKSYSTSSKVITKMSLNSSVTITAIKGKWCRVESDGNVAFMKKSDLSTEKTKNPSKESDPSPKKPAKASAKEMDWWTSDIQSIFSRGTSATITDVKTGISWKVIRKGGSNHADVQPLTAKDTAAMKEACGGSWSWNRRAIWVTIDGNNYAASMNCMPHGSGSITGNNFNGHHCIHFTNSRTHGGNKLCSLHQAAIKIAAGASL